MGPEMSGSSAYTPSTRMCHREETALHGYLNTVHLMGEERQEDCLTLVPLRFQSSFCRRRPLPPLKINALDVQRRQQDTTA